MEIILKKTDKIEGIIEVPADKSITHRSIMLSSIAEGISAVKNYLMADDCFRTLEAFKQMGVEIDISKDTLFIKGKGLNLQKPEKSIYCGNSGTTARLLSGILVGQNFESSITGDESLSKRPMNRIMKPLSQMGAVIDSKEGYLPLKFFKKGDLNGIQYKNDKASAQVKTSVLFAALYAKGETVYSEPYKSRDHSERMLKSFGADIKTEGNIVIINPGRKLKAAEITVPGDISSAAFFIVAALIVPDSNLTIKNVNFNPTRNALVEVLLKMGADIKIFNQREISGETVCDMTIKSSKLKAVDIGSEIIPAMIDEIPVFALAAACAQGRTKVSGADELRVKESDRIKVIAGEFSKLGIEIEEKEDGFIINGNPEKDLIGADVESFGDHRIAMTLAVASLIAKGEMRIKNSECVNISFPDFFEVLKSICR